MNKWNSIDQLRSVVKSVRWISQHASTDHTNAHKLPTLLFRGTVKLHGSNAGITRINGQYVAQSRSRMLSIDSDNYGFAHALLEWTNTPDIARDLNALFDQLELIASNQMEDYVPDNITVYGEWVGPGIQSAVGISKIPEKSLFLFGAKFLDVPLEWTSTFNVPSCNQIYNILDFPVFFVGVDFNVPDQAVPQFERLVDQVESQCPVSTQLGYPGIGEGLVWTCVEFPSNTSLWFKTKGIKHAAGDGTAKAMKKLITVDPVKLNNINEFIDHVVNVERLNQGLCNVESIDMKSTGTFIKWVCGDIIKEETDTMLASGLQWTDVSKQIAIAARLFFVNKVNSDL